MTGCSNLQASNGSTAGNSSAPAANTTSAATPAVTVPVETTPVKTTPVRDVNDSRLLHKYTTRIFPGVKVQGIDVGNLTKEEALAKLRQELIVPLADRYVLYSYNGIDDYMSYNRLEVDLDAAVVEEALQLGKTEPESIQLIYAKNSLPKDLPARLTFDRDHINRVAADIGKIVAQNSLVKTAEMRDGRVILKDGVMADQLNEAKFIADLTAAITFDPEDNQRVAAQIDKVPVPISQSDLDSITTQVSSFTTDYSWSPAGRYHNVELSAALLNGSLVMPGQTYSFNATLGPTTKERDFWDAGVYLNGQLVQEPGGGACQVSSTMYNALIYAGITPVERNAHGMVVGYLPYGMDAMVYDPYSDLKFVNPFDTPIFITAQGSGGDLTFTIWGKAGLLNGYSYTFTQDIYEHTPAITETQEDPNLPRGYKKLVRSPYDGYKVRVYRQTYKDGALVSNELYHEDEYRTVNTLYLVGTGDPATTAVPAE